MQKAAKRSQQCEKKLEAESRTTIRSILTAKQKHFFDMMSHDEKSAESQKYTAEQKALSLGLYKTSPSAYPDLQKMLQLPSPKTLKESLSKMNVNAGLNPLIMKTLKKTVGQMNDPRDKLVVLSWDETSLTPQLEYDPKSDHIVGFKDSGTRRTSGFSNRVLVFMVSGVRNKWLLPLSFNLCDSERKSSQLITLITAHVEALKKAGLEVVATVCDQGASNDAAIKFLVERGRKHSIKNDDEHNIMLIADTKVIPLYNPSNLLKSLRDNLMNNDLEYKSNGEGQTFLAKWSHVKLVYDLDCKFTEADGDMNLTKDHVNPKGSVKKEVKYAAEIFSKNVSGMMNLLSLSAPHAMPKESQGTSLLLNFGNNLFESMNGLQSKRNKKTLEGAVSSCSPHMSFWDKAIKTIQSMKFMDKKTMQQVRQNIPCLRNWINTIEGMKKLWKHLESEGFDSFSPRNLNHDCFENFLEGLRDQADQDENPTSQQITEAYKVLLIRNLYSRNSLKVNREHDEGSLLLNLIRALGDHDGCDILWDDFFNQFEEKSFGDEKNSEIYTLKADRERAAFHVARMISKSVDHCSQCRSSMFHTEHPTDCGSNLSDSALKANYAESFDRCCDVLKKKLPRFAYQHELAMKLTCCLIVKDSAKWIHCSQHASKVKNLFYKNVITLYIDSFCNSVNRVLTGKDVSFSNHSNCIVKQARAYRDKHLA